MQPHDSIPYNPDIVNVFQRAGYIEIWGQGIKKICDECIALGAELPKYETKHQNTDKHGALDDAMVLKITEILKEKPDISQEALGENMRVTRRVVQKYIN